MTGGPLRVELFSVPGCPNVERTRCDLVHVLDGLGIRQRLIEHVGAYRSPTVVVDGIDVMTNRKPELGAACRLDLPSRHQLGEALRRALR